MKAREKKRRVHLCDNRHFCLSNKPSLISLKVNLKQYVDMKVGLFPRVHKPAQASIDKAHTSISTVQLVMVSKCFTLKHAKTKHHETDALNLVDLFIS